ncbi:MAG TPA: glycosyl hydrolase, partial [Vicinamibacteria bacterium]|nr:glycosyl hydrolase [Vicinamibacteria bacterium]
MLPPASFPVGALIAVALAGAGEALAQAPAGRARPTSAAQAVPAGPLVDASLLRALKARSIGPAVMGGRVSEIALDPKDPFTFYVALGTGGVMKTSDNGVTWEAVFAREAVAAVGAVAVSPADPKVVWVGTGEANDRNSSSWGDGVYRSADGGATWKHVGLRASRAIARIVVHPTDADTAWVAALGDLWQPGGERGLYKTTDGGATWKAVLAADPPYAGRVGCGEVALDPSDPGVLYAALYAR